MKVIYDNLCFLEAVEAFYGEEPDVTRACTNEVYYATLLFHKGSILAQDERVRLFMYYWTMIC
jgi:hypothetical protein